MKHVTRNIDPNAAHDLLERVPRACIAFATEEGPRAQPVLLNWYDSQFRIGFPVSATPYPKAGQEVVLLVDEGVYYFDLRAVYVRGTSQSVQPPSEMPSEHVWFEIVPSKTIAWDYGTMHEVDNDP